MRMLHAGLIVGCIAGSIMLLCGPNLPSQTVKAKVTFNLLYSRIDVTEPVILKLEIANLTDEDLDLNLGWRDQIYFTATGPSGRMEAHEPPPNSFDQVSRFGEVAISPKGTYTQEIVLSQWASFDAPGDYAIELQLRGPLGLKSSDSLLVQTESVQLKVESNAVQLVQRHCVQEWDQLRGAKNGGEAMNAALFLGNVKSPLAVPFLKIALETEHATAIGGILITGLESIGNLNAVRALARVMDGKNDQNAQFAHDALARIAQERKALPDAAKEARLALVARPNRSKP